MCALCTRSDASKWQTQANNQWNCGKISQALLVTGVSFNWDFNVNHNQQQQQTNSGKE